MTSLRSLRRHTVFVATLLAFSACGGTTNLYHWGEYQESIYARYLDNDPKQAEEQLVAVIQDAQASGLRVPPGVYADYGFVLYQRGDKAGAAEYFQRESAAFPESAPLMQKLISRVQSGDLSDPGSREAEPKGPADRSAGGVP